MLKYSTFLCWYSCVVHADKVNTSYRKKIIIISQWFHRLSLPIIVTLLHVCLLESKRISGMGGIGFSLTIFVNHVAFIAWKTYHVSWRFSNCTWVIWSHQLSRLDETSSSSTSSSSISSSVLAIRISGEAKGFAVRGRGVVAEVWGRSPQRGPGGQGRSPPEAEEFWALERQRKLANLPPC